MKKFLLFFAVLFAMSLVSKAQIVLSEGFENGIPSTWTTIDADADGSVWEVMDGLNNGHNGSASCATSASYDNSIGALTPDNWLVTPQINVQNGFSLTFFVSAQDASWYQEHYAVMLSTTGNQQSDFSVTLMEETFSPTRASTDYVQKTIDLSPYAGQQVYIAFRHYDVTDMFRINIDDVTVGTGTSVENVAETTVGVYPNPASNMINIASAENIDQIQIVNMAGQCVYSANVAGNNVQVNVSDLADGMYFVKITANGAETVKKINVVK